MIRAKLYWIAEPPYRLAIMGRPRGGDWLSEELASIREQGVDILVSLLTLPEALELGLAAEADDCMAVDIRFLWLPIEDRGTPVDMAGVRTLVDRLAEECRDGRGVAIHCRAGIGRSALIVACILCGLGRSPGHAFDQIAHARGCPVPDTPEQRTWVEAFVRGEDA